MISNFNVNIYLEVRMYSGTLHLCLLERSVGRSVILRNVLYGYLILLFIEHFKLVI